VSPTLFVECRTVDEAERFIARSEYRTRLYYVAAPRSAVKVWLAPERAA